MKMGRAGWKIGRWDGKGKERRRWEGKDEDGKGRMKMGRAGWRWEGKDKDGKGRMEMRIEG